MDIQSITTICGGIMSEYLNNICDPLKTISETNIVYTNVYDTADIVYGAPNWQTSRSFKKFSVDVDRDPDLAKLTGKEKHVYDTLGQNTSGCFLRFRTKSKRIILKAHIRRKWDFGRLTLSNSSGFDIYEVDKDGNYFHKKVIAPKTGENIFADEFEHDRNTEVHIYLPASNEIEELYIGVEGVIKPCMSVNEPPIIFYGNSITQGGSASRSGNTFCNIVSRKLDNEIYNLSVSMCCKGFNSVAKYMGMLNARAIVIDFTRNANNYSAYDRVYGYFYETIRKYHKDIKVILMDTSNFNDDSKFRQHDETVYRTYEEAIAEGHNTYLLKQKDLFEPCESDLATVDGIHYTDYGMFKIADALCSLLESNG